MMVPSLSACAASEISTLSKIFGISRSKCFAKSKSRWSPQGTAITAPVP